MKRILPTALLFFWTFAVSAWGPDVLVDTANAIANISVIEGNDGALYMSIPDPVFNNGVALRFRHSLDHGTTWQEWPVTGSGNDFVQRTKLVAAPNEVWCIFIVDRTLHVLDVNSGSESVYSDLAVGDFDVAMSSTGWMYVFMQEFSSTNIYRTATADAGATWEPTASVSAAGLAPRISLSEGDTLLVDFILVPTGGFFLGSRQGIYEVIGPGILAVTATGFLDLQWSFVSGQNLGSVQQGGIVWKFRGGGTATRDIQMKVSSDGGVTYGPTTTVSGAVDADEFGFAALPRTGIDQGVDLVYVHYPTDTTTSATVVHVFAAHDAPAQFSAPTTISELPPLAFSASMPPQLMVFADASLGVAWVGTDSGEVNVYFDHQLDDVSVPTTAAIDGTRIYPNPTAGSLTLELSNTQTIEHVLIRDPMSRLIRKIERVSSVEVVDLSDLPQGICLLEVVRTTGSTLFRVVVE
ncbi:MAG: T9SS type A sorting domain-containing protein [Flavobacteriales bacterium]|nr:T9SS type A sorting domain-containing protein [Flavobacteriales bacterium]